MDQSRLLLFKNNFNVKRNIEIHAETVYAFTSLHKPLYLFIYLFVYSLTYFS